VNKTEKRIDTLMASEAQAWREAKAAMSGQAEAEQQIASLTAKVERYEGALREIAEKPLSFRGSETPPERVVIYAYHVIEVRLMARRAVENDNHYGQLIEDAERARLDADKMAALSEAAPSSDLKSALVGKCCDLAERGHRSGCPNAPSSEKESELFGGEGLATSEELYGKRQCGCETPEHDPRCFTRQKPATSGEEK
jgi:hypothetical protein